MNFLRLASFLLVASVSTPAAAEVHVLQNGSGTVLAAMVGAVADGDTILVKGGGAFTYIDIFGKGVRIVAEGPVAPTIRRIQVQGTSASQLVSVSGFHVANVSIEGGIIVRNCAGSVRFTDVVFDTALQPTLPPSPGARIENSPDVALTRCTLFGVNGAGASLAEVGVLCRMQSRVALFDCAVRGGRGANGSYTQLQGHVMILNPATPGADGIEVEDTSTCFVARCAVEGGAGGNGAPLSIIAGTFSCMSPTNGAQGGNALAVSPTAIVNLLGTTAVGGAGGLGGTGGMCPCIGCGTYPPGAPGPAGTGASNTLSGAGVALSLPASARANDVIPITVTGTPGAQATLAVSLNSQWSQVLPFRGVFTCGPAFRRFALGVIPGNGILVTSLTTPGLAGLVGTLMLHVQIVTQTATFETDVGTGQVLCMFDPSY